MNGGGYWKVAALCMGAGAVFAEEKETAIDTLYVIGERQASFDEDSVLANQPRHGHADAARLLALLSGASLNDNGALSGQVQYRGMSGPRMDVRVDGMHIPAGGPNWMDPPLHYAPMALLDGVRLKRGIASVASGGIGGQAQARWKRPGYGDGGWRPSLDFDSALRAVDEGVAVGAVVGLANHRQQFFLAGGKESGEDYDAAGGLDAAPTVQRGAPRGGA